MGQGQGPEVGSSLIEMLGRLPDPRSAHGKRHPLGAILGLAVCAMRCGARRLYAISQWGRDQGREVSAALGFTRERTPCVSTLHQVFSRLDREAFEQALGEQKNELDAVAGLLGQWDLKGLVVTGDAQFTQRVVCQRVVAQGGTTSSR